MLTFSEFVEQNDYTPSIMLQHEGFDVEEIEEHGRRVSLSSEELKAIADVAILDVFEDGECVLLDAEAVLDACRGMGEKASKSIDKKVADNLEILRDNIIYIMEEDGVITSYICSETGFTIWGGSRRELDRLGLY